jgi:hypothetical protein
MVGSQSLAEPDIRAFQGPVATSSAIVRTAFANVQPDAHSGLSIAT